MSYETIRYASRTPASRRSRSTSRRPRNALSDELLGELIDALEARPRRRRGPLRRAHLDPRPGVLEPAPTWPASPPTSPLVHKHFATERFPRVFTLLGELGKPSICAANGHVLAGALGLALACDLIIAEDAARFGTPEINVGLFPFMIMALIYRNVGRKKTAELMLLGRADLGRGGGADRDRQPGRAGRRVRRARRRVGASSWPASRRR